MEQSGKAVGFGGFSFELSDAQFQRVIFTAQVIVIFLGASQREVAAPGVSKRTEDIGAGPFKRRNRANRPGTNQAPLGIAFDLHGEEQNLEEDDSREQNQRFVTRGDGSHKKVNSSQLKVHNQDVPEQAVLGRKTPLRLLQKSVSPVD